jgi:hypothetical protein
MKGPPVVYLTAPLQEGSHDWATFGKWAVYSGTAVKGGITVPVWTRATVTE